MSSSRDTVHSGDRVEWKHIQALAAKTDELLKQKVIDPRDGKTRAGSYAEWSAIGNNDEGEGYDYTSRHPYLMKDLTSPFPIKFPFSPSVSKKGGVLVQRFEFAYYNLGPNKEYLYRNYGTVTGDPETIVPYKRRSYRKN